MDLGGLPAGGGDFQAAPACDDSPWLGWVSCSNEETILATAVSLLRLSG